MNLGTPPVNEQAVGFNGVLSTGWVQFLVNLYRVCLNQVESGTTAQRPTKTLYTGRRYFDTTLGYPIWHNGTIWVKSDGTAA